MRIEGVEIASKEPADVGSTTPGLLGPPRLTAKNLPGPGSSAKRRDDDEASDVSRATTMRADPSERKTDAAATKQAIAFYNGPFSRLVQRNAPTQELDAALVEEGGARVDSESGVWVLGPWSKPYPLSEWPRNKPFLVEAARLGGARIVDRLARHYKCSVIVDSAGGTALHQAAYFGHADVVATLLEFRANPMQTNKEGETALDSARQALVDWKSGAFKFPKLSGAKEIFDFRTRDASWPHWEEAIRHLS